MFALGGWREFDDITTTLQPINDICVEVEEYTVRVRFERWETSWFPRLIDDQVRGAIECLYKALHSCAPCDDRAWDKFRDNGLMGGLKWTLALQSISV